MVGSAEIDVGEQRRGKGMVELRRLIRPGGLFMMYVRLREEGEAPGPAGPRGVPEASSSCMPPLPAWVTSMAVSKSLMRS